MTMAVFGDYLYVGTAVGIGMVMKNNRVVGTRAIEIIRIDKNDNAELVVGALEASDPIEASPSRVSRAEWAPDSTTPSMSMPGK